MNEIHCSFFRKAADNRPKPWSGTWGQLRECLEQTYTPRPGSTGDAAKKSLPAICGTRFKPNTTRAAANAVDTSLIIFDFDNATEEHSGDYWPDPLTGKATTRPKLRKVMTPHPVTFEDVQEALWDAGVDSYSWDTWSAKSEWPKFRVVVPFAHPIPVELWEAATEWALKRLGLTPFLHGLDRPVLRDVARLNFLPGTPGPGLVRRGETKGSHLAIPLDQLVRATVPPLPIPDWWRELQALRDAENRSGDRWFQYYRVAGRPVDFHALDLASLFRGRGIKVGVSQAHGNGTKWRCHCPLAHEHSHGIDDDCAVIIQTPGQWPFFKCAHSHHAHLGLRDVIELFWGRP